MGKAVKRKQRCYLTVDFKRLFTGYPFYVAAGGIWGINLLNVLDEMRVVRETTVLYLFNGRAVVGAFEMLLIFFAVLPYCMSFAVDWDHGYYKQALIRGKRRCYLLSKVVTVAAGTLLAVVLGYLLFVLTLRMFYPLFPETAEDLRYYMELAPTAFPDAAFTAVPQIYYLVAILPEAFLYAFLACFSLYISSCSTNRFVILSAPVIFYYIYNHLSGTLRLPDILAWQLHRTGVFPDLPWRQNLLYTAGYYAIWIVFMGILFAGRARRKIQGEC